MPRQQRYFLPGVPQHIITRGVDRQATFFHENDYKLYLDTLLSASRDNACSVHAYVLMTNHVHLLVTPDHAHSIPKMMQSLGRGYVQRLNARYRRTGTLWEGRYKASPVQSERYVLVCYQYIEMNPVRAGMVASLDAYPYSSYRCNALGRNDPIIEAHELYRRLGRDDAERLSNYRELFAKDNSAQTDIDELRRLTNACAVIGNYRFKQQIERMIGRRVPQGRRGRPSRKRPAD